MLKRVTLKTMDFQSFSEESSKTTVWFFYLHYGLSLHLHQHTHSIHSKMPYLKNTQKRTSFFVVLCVTSKKFFFVVTLEMQDVKLYVGVVQMVTVIMTSVLVASLLWPVLSLSQQCSNLTIFFLCAAYLICFDPVKQTLAPLFFAFRIPHGLLSYVKGGLWSLWWDSFWSKGSDMIWALISLWSH